MPLTYADRVKETSTTTGTGTLDLAGTTSGFRTFVAGAGTGSYVSYTIAHQSADEWEVGIGVVTDASPDTLSRLTVLSSSNSGSLTSFSAGTKDVFLSLTSHGLGAIANDNLVYNGNFDVWQTGTSFATIADNAYPADGWQYVKNGAMVHTVSQSTDVPTVAQSGCLSTYSILVDCTTVDSSLAAGDHCELQHAIEGYDWRLVAQRDFTISFWVKATKTGTHVVAIRNGTDRSYVAEYTINTTATWEKKIINVPASPSAGTWNYTTSAGAYLMFGFASGSTFHTTAGAWQTGNYFGTSNQVNDCDNTSNDFRIAQVKLEPGKIATPFVPLPYDQVFRKACRYFFRFTPATDHVDYLRITSQWLQTVEFAKPAIQRARASFSSSGPSWVTGTPSGNQVRAYNAVAGADVTITGALTASGGDTDSSFHLNLTAGTSFSGSAGAFGHMSFGSTFYVDLSARI